MNNKQNKSENDPLSIKTLTERLEKNPIMDNLKRERPKPSNLNRIDDEGSILNSIEADTDNDEISSQISSLTEETNKPEITSSSIKKNPSFLKTRKNKPTTFNIQTTRKQKNYNLQENKFQENEKQIEQKKEDSKITNIPNELVIILRTSIPGFQTIIYKPNMTIPGEKNRSVQFNPLVKLNKSIINSIPKEIQVKEFFNKGLFESLINSHGLQKIPSLLEATYKGFVDNNIKITIETLFPTNSVIYIANQPYAIADVLWQKGKWEINNKILQIPQFDIRRTRNPFLYLNTIKEQQSLGNDQLNSIPPEVRYGSAIPETDREPIKKPQPTVAVLDDQLIKKPQSTVAVLDDQLIKKPQPTVAVLDDQLIKKPQPTVAVLDDQITKKLQPTVAVLNDQLIKKPQPTVAVLNDQLIKKPQTTVANLDYQLIKKPQSTVANLDNQLIRKPQQSLSTLDNQELTSDDDITIDKSVSYSSSDTLNTIVYKEPSFRIAKQNTNLIRNYLKDGKYFTMMKTIYINAQPKENIQFITKIIGNKYDKTIYDKNIDTIYINETKRDGNCFFIAVRDAINYYNVINKTNKYKLIIDGVFGQGNNPFTIRILREIVAQYFTEIYEPNNPIYQSLKEKIQLNLDETTKIFLFRRRELMKNLNEIFGSELENFGSDELNNAINEIFSFLLSNNNEYNFGIKRNPNYNVKKSTIIEKENLPFIEMSLEEIINFINSPNYWADELSIDAILNKLNIYIISIENKEQKLKSIVPTLKYNQEFKYYLFLYNQQNHFELISFNHLINKIPYKNTIFENTQMIMNEPSIKYPPLGLLFLVYGWNFSNKEIQENDLFHNLFLEFKNSYNKIENSSNSLEKQIFFNAYDFYFKINTTYITGYSIRNKSKKNKIGGTNNKSKKNKLLVGGSDKLDDIKIDEPEKVNDKIDNTVEAKPINSKIVVDAEPLNSYSSDIDTIESQPINNVTPGIENVIQAKPFNPKIIVNAEESVNSEPEEPEIIGNQSINYIPIQNESIKNTKTNSLSKNIQVNENEMGYNKDISTVEAKSVKPTIIANAEPINSITRTIEPQREVQRETQIKDKPDIKTTNDYSLKNNNFQNTQNNFGVVKTITNPLQQPISNLSYYITIDLELKKGTSLSTADLINLKCNQQFNKIRKNYAELRGLQYVIPPVYENLPSPKKSSDDKNLSNTKK
jgi:hypothetical protein